MTTRTEGLFDEVAFEGPAFQAADSFDDICGCTSSDSDEWGEPGESLAGLRADTADSALDKVPTSDEAAAKLGIDVETFVEE